VTWWRGLSARRRGLFGALAAVLVLALAAIVAIGLSTPDTPAAAPAQDRPGTVILVPGYGGSHEGLRVLADRIGAAGRQTRLVTLPGDGRGDLLAQVAALNRDVDAALAAGAPSVDVIGFSAGGVVARLWVAREDGEHRARRIITLGSPLHGTRLAASGTAAAPDACPLACQQLAPGSALLNSVEHEPVPLPWLSIWTENDQTVIPPDSARLDGALNVVLQQICPGVHIEHSALPIDPLTTQLVLRALEPGALRIDGIACP
jgi:triacylglycerol lipase